MSIATISSKGQITLPSQHRRKLGIGPGSKVEVSVRGGELVVRPVLSLTELQGVFREQARRKGGDWEKVRTETERQVATEVEDAGEA